MAGRGRSGANEALIAALASGQTIVDAARVAQVGERTVWRRLQDPQFKAALSAARARLVDASIGVLADAATEAAQTLIDLLDGSEPRVRRLAARDILALVIRMRESEEYEARIRELERRVFE